MNQIARARKILVMTAVVLSAAGLAMSPVFACHQPSTATPPVVVPDTAKIGQFFVFVGGSTFGGADPNTAKCACGLTIPTTGVAVTGAAVVDPNNVLVPGFSGFVSDPNSLSAFTSLQAPPSGKTWTGFSSPITTAIPTGAAASLRFSVSAPGFADPALLAQALQGGFAGSAKSDLGGGNFDPAHRGAVLLSILSPLASAIPTLSEWGLISLVGLLVVAGGLIIAKRGL